jgi:hypothetical protein
MMIETKGRRTALDQLLCNEISNFLLSDFYLDSRQISLKSWGISLAFVVFTTADMLQWHCVFLISYRRLVWSLD